MFLKILFSVEKGKDYLSVMQELCRFACLVKLLRRLFIRRRGSFPYKQAVRQTRLDSNRLKNAGGSAAEAESNQRVRPFGGFCPSLFWTQKLFFVKNG